MEHRTTSAAVSRQTAPPRKTRLCRTALRSWLRLRALFAAAVSGVMGLGFLGAGVAAFTLRDDILAAYLFAYAACVSALLGAGCAFLCVAVRPLMRAFGLRGRGPKRALHVVRATA